MFESSEKRILFLNTYYPNYLNRKYSSNPLLVQQSYSEQLRSLIGDFFGDSDYYSKGLENVGWKTEEVIINCAPLQNTWAKENGFGGEVGKVLFEQIKSSNPHVVYIQDLHQFKGEFAERIRQLVPLVVGQMATPISEGISFDKLDLIFSSFPHFITNFRKLGIPAYYQPLAFEPKILNCLESASQKTPVSFVGGISNLHIQGNQLLESLAKATPIQFWGYGSEYLGPDNIISKKHKGEAWGLEMFNIFHNSQMTINRHGEVAENYANNMRLFEATGCGCLLITDYKDNLNELFEIGKEIVAFRSVDECIDLVHYYLNHPREAESIAAQGQKKTLENHTYAKRMVFTSEIIERHLKYKSEITRYNNVNVSNVSHGFADISKNEVTSELENAWKSKKIPQQQRALVQSELSEMYRGQTNEVFKILVKELEHFFEPEDTVLEVGCASGYYYEILNYLLQQPIRYFGVDYSKYLIQQGREYYPHLPLINGDGAHLPFSEGQFKFVISSGILLHVSNYFEHIYETIRVAKKYVILHRTPICKIKDTQFQTKFAYNEKTVEILFNENEILTFMEKNNLILIQSDEYNREPNSDRYYANYLFKKSEN